MVPRQIFDATPSSWRDLQDRVAQVFNEIGCESHSSVTVRLPRGTVELDVFVRDSAMTPPSNYVCECKNWQRAVPKSVVHGFRTVVSELGANRGMIISRRGFQAGAKEAAQFTNVDLQTWQQFQSVFFERWLAAIQRRLDPFFRSAHELMDPSNSEGLWRGRACNDEAWEEWDTIGRRFPLVTVWALFNWHSKAGFVRVPRMLVTDEGALSDGGKPVVFDTCRKVADAAPTLCQIARRQLEEFWSRVPRLPEDHRVLAPTRLSPVGRKQAPQSF